MNTELSSRKRRIVEALAVVMVMMSFLGVPALSQPKGPLQLHGQIELPAHIGPGGFDHADIHPATGRIFVAHTANDSLDVIDGANDRFLHSIPNLKGVAGALVTPEANLVFTSNRGENTVGIFPFNDEGALVKVPVGASPNGLAHDPKRNLLLVAHGGNPATVIIVDAAKRTALSTITVPGRTRWAVFDPQQEMFFVNISDPPVIVGIKSNQPGEIARTYKVPAAGPHGLALDSKTRRLFCACDAKKLIVLSADTGEVQRTLELSGGPDVLFLNAARRHLYAAVGDPGVIDVFEVDALELIQTVPTEKGANTIAFDAARNKIYAFQPRTHSAAVFLDRE
ncbi:MAG TPA: hypothetical protein VEU11_12105 [Terriglobales bacterium]|nr:hypothetical protein [Terriglobales bacterium]